MKINDKISMEVIYKQFEKQMFIFDEIEIIIMKGGSLCINYKGKVLLDTIFEKPLKIKYNDKKIDIISTEHLYIISKRYKIVNLMIICETCNQVINIEFDVDKHKNHELSMKDDIKYQKISENDFNKFFDKEKERAKGFLGKIFKSPEKFEKNFNYYIKDYIIYQNKPFELYENEKRNIFMIKLIQTLHYCFGKLLSYFGQSGIGKTISILVISKYAMNHILYGTLYLNLKCFKKLLENEKYFELKQIIIDELPYLFYGKYNDYIKCTNSIQQSQVENEDSIWTIVTNIIKYIISIDDNKSYIFIFDQYNNKIDKNDKIITIYQEFVENNGNRKKNIGFVTLSSMNNKDIKNYKINFIGKQFDENYEKSINFIKQFRELEDIINIDTFKFEDDSLDEHFNNLGRNVKYYNILTYHYNNKGDIYKLMEGIKQDIKENIKIYYECNEDERNIIKLLYFSTKTQY